MPCRFSHTKRGKNKSRCSSLMKLPLRNKDLMIIHKFKFTQIQSSNLNLWDLTLLSPKKVSVVRGPSITGFQVINMIWKSTPTTRLSRVRNIIISNRSRSLIASSWVLWTICFPIWRLMKAEGFWTILEPCFHHKVLWSQAEVVLSDKWEVLILIKIWYSKINRGRLNLGNLPWRNKTHL
jgi:hypothetical protein